TKTKVGAAHVVVNGLGNGHHVYATLEQLLRDGLRVVSAQRDQGVHAILLQVLDAAVHAISLLCGIRARSAEDGSATRQDPGHSFQVQGLCQVFQHAAPAFEKADELVVVMKLSFAHDGAYDRVQSGAIPAAGKNSDLHGCALSDVMPVR